MAILTFELEIERSLEIEELAWVSDDEAVDDSCLGGNQHYVDLRYASWNIVEETLILERDLLSLMEKRADAGVVYAAYRDGLYDDPDNPFAILDLGVASLVYSLAAAGCIPFSSCNAGALGDHFHAEAFPLVAFFLRPDLAELILTCAEGAGVGLTQNHHGEVLAYASALSHLVDFAAAIFDQRELLDRQARLWQFRAVSPP